ncbi:MAG: M1 family aminopeptidase, partial [Planctomycetota bacterium]|nr:M1 family aminopeptidase [Planctomycetota bacterium]
MNRPSLAALAAAFLTCTLPGTPASAQDVPADLRIEAETGRSRAHFPPHRFFDHQHLRLEIDIPTMAEAKLSARASLTVEAIGSTRSEIFLFAKGPKLTRAAVKLAGGGETPAAFRETPGGYTISLPTPLNPGERAEVLYDYDLDFSGNTGNGLTRVAPKDSGGATDTAPMIFSQGQPEENRRWIPGHDFPNERLSTELIVTVESGYEVISNGRLVERTDPSPGRTRFHWRQAQPHPLYLTALAVGKFVSIDLMNPPERHAWIMPAGLREKVVNDRGEAIPMRVWLPAGQEEQGWKLYGATPAMVAFFNDKLGQPYPWDKYDQIVVRNFPWGGMENVTATIMYEGSLNGERGDQDDLIAH